MFNKLAILRAIIVLLLRRIHAEHTVDIDASVLEHPAVHEVPLKHPRYKDLLKVQIHFRRGFGSYVYSAVENLTVSLRVSESLARGANRRTTEHRVVQHEGFRHSVS